MKVWFIAVEPTVDEAEICRAKSMQELAERLGVKPYDVVSRVSGRQPNRLVDLNWRTARTCRFFVRTQPRDEELELMPVEEPEEELPPEPEEPRVVRLANVEQKYVLLLPYGHVVYPRWHCQHCEGRVTRGEKYCPWCGSEIVWRTTG